MNLARSGDRPPAASQPLASGTVYEYFNWERVIDHVGAVVLVVSVRMRQAARILGAGQQRVLPRLLRCQPIEFPTPPRMPSHRIKEFCLGPGSATVGADCDLCHIGFACPCSAGNRVDTVRGHGFVNTRPSDF